MENPLIRFRAFCKTDRKETPACQGRIGSLLAEGAQLAEAAVYAVIAGLRVLQPAKKRAGVAPFDVNIGTRSRARHSTGVDQALGSISHVTTLIR